MHLFLDTESAEIQQFMDPEIVKMLQFLDPETKEMVDKSYIRKGETHRGGRGRRNAQRGDENVRNI